MSATTRDDARRLVSVAHARTKDLPPDLPLEDVYRQAARRAERCLDEPLGSALAGVLVMEAERLASLRWNRTWGQSRTMISLALTVISMAEMEGMS